MMKTLHKIPGVVNSRSSMVEDAARLIESLDEREVLMSSKLQNLMEELRHELQKKTTSRNVKIDTLIRKYRPMASERERSIIREHIIPVIGKLTVAQVDVKGFCESHLGRPVSSAKKILKCFERILQGHDETFKLPPVKYRNPGRKWTSEHILTEEQVAQVIGRVYEPYRPLCWISVYTLLRLGNVVNLARKDVDLKTEWVKVNQTKTGKPVEIPFSDPLRRVFAGLKRLPLGPDDRLFPEFKANPVAKAVKRAFGYAGIPWGSFHHFRHFGACYLIDKGVDLVTIRDLLGHSDFKSTLVYARIKKEKLQQAVRAFNG